MIIIDIQVFLFISFYIPMHLHPMDPIKEN